MQVISEPDWAYHLALVIGGAQITQVARSRQDPASSDVCPDCERGQSESPQHRFWQCGRWRHIRETWGCSSQHELPPCFATHGTLPAGHRLSLEQVMRTQAMQCHISLEAAGIERAAVREHDMHVPNPQLLQRWLQLHG